MWIEFWETSQEGIFKKCWWQGLREAISVESESEGFPIQIPLIQSTDFLDPPSLRDSNWPSGQNS